MKKWSYFLYAGLLISVHSFSQMTSPYDISPQWMFGFQAGLNFNGGTPVFLAGNPTTAAIVPGSEGTSALSDTNRNLLVYTNVVHIYNAANASVRDMNTTDLVAANSATQGCVIFPDPAAPFSQYYLFIANDLTAGLRANKGIYYYRLQKSGASVAVLSGPTQIATTTEVDESIFASSDLNGGYWVVSKAQGNNEVWSWRVTTTGVSAVNKTSTSPYVGGTANGAIKINQCQNKIAIVGNGHLQVFEWNATTGKPGANLFSKNYSSILYGVEFSPDGNMVYFSQLSTPRLVQVNLTNGVETILSSASLNNNNQIGGIQLGRDGKIYVANAAFNQATPVQIGVIHNPNTAGTGSNYNNPSSFSLPTSAVTLMPSVFIGMANQPWINPKPLEIKTIAGDCQTFDSDLRSYYGKKINLRNDATLRWDFGDGAGWRTGQGFTPTFNYAANGSYNVRLEGRDELCGHQFSTQRTINVTCVLPVEWVFTEAKIKNGLPTIQFATTKEFDVSHFIILRSYDGVVFNEVAKIAPKGNNRLGVNHYEWVDENSKSGLVYYRIDQFDLNQNSPNSSRTLSVVSERDLSSARISKLSDNEFKIDHTIQNGQVTVFDLTGKKISESRLNAGKFSINGVQQQSSQIVIIKIVDDSGSQTISKTLMID